MHIHEKTMRWKVLPKCCFYLTLCNLNFLLGMPQLWMYRWNNKRGMVILENKTKGNPKMRFASITNNWGFYWIVQTLSWALPLFQSMEKWIPGKNGSDGIVVPDGFWVVQMFLVSFHFAFPFPFCWHSYSMHPSVNVSPILYFLFVPLTIH